MNIGLTKQELVMLLCMANIGDWVMFADLAGEELEDEDVVKHRAVLRKLFAAAHKAKLDGVVRYDAELKDYFETGDFEEHYQLFIGEFNDRQFWDELSDRLAIRDLVHQIGADAFEAMDPLERGDKLHELSVCYDEEFEKHGLQRLQMLNTAPAGKGKA